MKLRTMMLHADSDDRFAYRLSIAAKLARDNDAKLFVVAAMLPPMASVAYGEYVPAQAIEAQIVAERQRADEIHKVVASRLTHEGITWEWRAMEGHPETILPGAGAMADLIVMGQDTVDSDSPVVAAVAMTSGRPVLCIPHSGEFMPPWKRVLLAWNGSREAARAAHDALPLLTTAEQVILFTAAEGDESDASAHDAAAHLSAHGAKVEISRASLTGIDIGAALLNAASDNGADLLVMGAYGHSRLREWVFGGATRTLLQSMTVPVLLSH